MKQHKRLLSVFFAILLAVACLSISAYAVSATQDGLVAEILTDKDSYSVGEEIQVTVKVKNTNSFLMKHVSIKGLLPDGLIVKTGGSLTKQVEVLNAGESMEVAFTAVKAPEQQTAAPDSSQPEESTTTPGGEPTTRPDITEDGENAAATQEEENPDTGDNSGIMIAIYSLLSLCAFIALFFTLRRKGRTKMNRVLSILLCFALLAPSICGVGVYTAQALNDQKEFTVTETVIIDGQEKALKATIVYHTKGTTDLAIDRTPFSYNDVDQIYELLNDIDAVSGTLKNSESIKTFHFSVYDKKGTEIDKGDIRPSDLWSCDSVGFVIGYNRLVVTAIYEDGTKATDKIEFNCYSDTRFDELLIDVVTDSDKDGLVDYLEDYCGSNKNLVDTDGDGLTDYQEEVTLLYSAANQDTDGDGTTDYHEDYDEDGLIDGKEFEIGTDPQNGDSDYDGLTDSEEVDRYHTDPLLEDTDGDGASDGDEVERGTNPLVAESSFVEIADFGEVTEAFPVSARVETVVKGEQVGTLQIDPVTVNDNPLINAMIPGYLDVGFDFTIEGEINEALITFTYDESLGTLSDSFQPRIYYYNEESKLLEELPDQTVENGRVSARVSHFSTYIMLNRVEFDKVWETEIKTPEDQESQMTGLDVVFVIDSSGSMTSNDRNHIRHIAAKNFVEKLGENDRAAVIDFDDYASVKQEFTNDHNLLNSSIDTIDSNGGTNLSRGISAAIDLFTSDAYGRTDAYKYIIFLTDGEGSYSSSYTAEAAENDIAIYTIGLGSGVNERVLQEIAAGTGGKYYFASLAEELPDIYDDVSFETVDYVTDSNNDGISDYYTQLIYEGKMACSNGSQEFMGINFNYDENQNGTISNDYDGDGLLNGQELVVDQVGEKVYLRMDSDPMMKNSDTDNYPDAMEYEDGSDRLTKSYNSSSIEMFTNDDFYVYPDIAVSEDDLLNNSAKWIWNAITFDWSQKDEAKNLISKFLGEYNTVKEINLGAENGIRDLVMEIGHQFLSSVRKYLDDKVEDTDRMTEIASVAAQTAKKWIAASHSMANLNADFWGDLKGTVKLFVQKYDLSGLDIEFNFKDFDTKLGVGFALLEEGLDVWETIEGYSAIKATTAQFKVNEDILDRIINSDANDEFSKKYVRNAASDLKSYIDNEEKIYRDQWSDIRFATLENIASYGVSLLLSANPLLKAIDLLIMGLDWFLPITEIKDATYHMFTIVHISNAVKGLLHIQWGNFLCTPQSGEERLLKALAVSRAYGEEWAAAYMDKIIIIGMSKEERQQEVKYIRENIENIYSRCDKLGI